MRHEQYLWRRQPEQACSAKPTFLPITLSDGAYMSTYRVETGSSAGLLNLRIIIVAGRSQLSSLQRSKTVHRSALSRLEKTCYRVPFQTLSVDLRLRYVFQILVPKGQSRGLVTDTLMMICLLSQPRSPISSANRFR